MKRTFGVLVAAAAVAATFAGPSSADTTDARAAATSAVTSLLASFGDQLTQLAPATTPDSASPTPDLASSHSTVVLDDASLQQTRWWTVPLPVTTLESDLENGTDGFAVQFPASTSSTGTGTVLLSSSVAGDSTSQYTAPTMMVELEGSGDTTSVRADGFVAARTPRPAGAHIGGAIRSVVVKTSMQTEVPGRRDKKTAQRFAARSAEASLIVTALNAMPGLPDVQQSYPPPPCAVAPSRTTVTITVRTSTGTTLVSSQSPQPCVQPAATVTQGRSTATLDATAFQQEFPSFFGQPITAPQANTTVQNKAAAAKESADLLAAVGADLQAAGAVSDPYAPIASLQSASEYPGMGVDPDLTRTGWWTVPRSLAATAAYLHSHVPSGLTDNGLGTFSISGPGGVIVSGDDQMYSGRSTAAYDAGQIDTIVESIDATDTAVRVDSYISERIGRPRLSFIDGDVKKIVVAMSTTKLRQVHHTSTIAKTHSRGTFTLTGATVDRLIHTLNGLPGPEAYPGVNPGGPACRPNGATIDVATLTFRGADFKQTVRLTKPECGGVTAAVRIDGKRQGPLLPADPLYATIRAWARRVS